MTAEQAIGFIDTNAGTHFDPLVVAALNRHLDTEGPLVPEP
jgi:HD-GYP domain-containing protein (c-di-GMP phosphodiesterase class II)